MRAFFHVRLLKKYKKCIISRHFTQKKYILGLGPGCGPKPKTKINSEVNSRHFGIEIKKIFKIFDNQKMFGSKNFSKIKKKNSYIFLSFLRPKDLWVLRILNVC